MDSRHWVWKGQRYNRARIRGFRAPHLRHRHGKALDNHIVVEGFEHVFRCQGVVNSSVFVVIETFQLLLANVYHPRVWEMY